MYEAMGLRLFEARKGKEIDLSPTSVKQPTNYQGLESGIWASLYARLFSSDRSDTHLRDEQSRYVSQKLSHLAVALSIIAIRQ